MTDVVKQFFITCWHSAKEVMRVSVFIYVLVCQQDYTKSYKGIWLKFSGQVRLNLA